MANSKSVMSVLSALMLVISSSTVIQALDVQEASKEMEELETRSIFASDNGQLFLALNDTTIILGAIGLVALAAVLYFAVTYSAAGSPVAYDRFYYDPYAHYGHYGQHYYDPDLIAQR